MKNTKKMAFQFGDSVKIKKGVKDSFNASIAFGGFEGRIFDMYTMFDKEQIIEIEFDSITIRQMTDKFIRYQIEQDIDYACRDFKPVQVVLSKPRDTMADVVAARREIRKKYKFTSILDKKGMNVWTDKPQPQAIPSSSYPNAPTMRISMAFYESFVKAFKKVQKKKAIIEKQALEVRKLEKIKVKDFLEIIHLPLNIGDKLLPKNPKEQPFTYMEEITKEKFLAVRGLGPRSWEFFEMFISRGLDFTKYKYVKERWAKQILGHK